MPPPTLTLITSADIAGADDQSRMDWSLVVRCLHTRGDFYGSLTHDQHVEVRLMADGHGYLPALRSSVDEDQWGFMLWDWSHIRDSTAGAISRMAEALREIT